MSDSTYRLIFAGLALALIAVIGFAVAFSPSGRPVEIPAPIERLFPPPNDSAIRQTALEVDMAAGYEAVFIVDGIRIAPSEVREQVGTGLFTWRPAPGQFIESWAPGPHEVTVEWDTATGLPDPGSFTWTFRVR